MWKNLRLVNKSFCNFVTEKINFDQIYLTFSETTYKYPLPYFHDKIQSTQIYHSIDPTYFDYILHKRQMLKINHLSVLSNHDLFLIVFLFDKIQLEGTQLKKLWLPKKYTEMICPRKMCNIRKLPNFDIEWVT